MESSHGLPLRNLNHISRVCRDVAKTASFYRDVLGFYEVKRPASFDFEGAWLFNYGIGVHLIAGNPLPRQATINPKSDHLSFQADSLEEVEQHLKQRSMEYVRQTIDEGGVKVTQLFFHDPENNMIEICNCDLFPVVPLGGGDAAMCPTCTMCAHSDTMSQPEPSEGSSMSMEDRLTVPDAWAVAPLRTGIRRSCSASTFRTLAASAGKLAPGTLQLPAAGGPSRTMSLKQQEMDAQLEHGLRVPTALQQLAC